MTLTEPAVGLRAGLASERAYVRGVLPRAVLGAIADAVRRRQPSVVSRAFATALGLAAATSGYALSRLRRLSAMS